ncbi:hypothetical protein JG688_00018473, partial [Phytophthora aleatoria]
LQLYASPSSSAGVERHHKVAKRIHSPTRNIRSKSKLVAHNAAVVTQNLPEGRQRFEKRMVAIAIGIGSNAGDDEYAVNENDDALI